MTALFVGLGGFLGTLCRYWAYVLLKPCETGFPWATFAVNTTGCFLIGCVFFWGQKQEALAPYFLPMLMTGFLGGFTTFSAFGIETFGLVQNQHFLLALLNVVGSVLLGLGAIAVAAFLFQ